MRASRRPTGPGVYWTRSRRCRRATCSVRPRPSSRIPSGTGPLGQRFSMNTLPPFATRPVSMASVRNIAPQPRSMSTTIDVDHDRADKDASRRIDCPMLHLWAEGGWLDTYYKQDGGPLGIWRQWAPHVQGQALKGGHFFPEENPEDTTVVVKRFLSA